MALTINNTSGLFTTSQLKKSQESLFNSLEKISSGHRINKAADDAAGLTIADSLGSQARGFGQAIRNANDAISTLQIADGSLNEATDLLQSIRVKTLQAANGSQSEDSRRSIQAEIDKSLEQLDNIANTTSFNGQKLLSGQFTNKNFQVGANANETITVSLGSVETSNLGNSESGQLSEIDVTTQEGAQAALVSIDASLAQINSIRSEAGSQQNKLTSTLSNLTHTRVNTLSAESSIRDVDFAEEVINLNKFEVLNKVRVFAASQANANAKNVLNILQGDL